MLKGVLAAAVTPLREEGAALDDDAFGAYADFLVAGGLDGILALGTTGEGILLTLEERKRVARLFLDAIAGRMQVAVHCGAQTTADTVHLAQHSAEAGADAVAVIGPPLLPVRRGVARASLRRCCHGVRTASLLPLRIPRAHRVLPAGLPR